MSGSNVALLAAFAAVLVACPSREDFLLVPEVRDASGTCGGSPEVLSLGFTVVWANGDRADPVTVAVGAHVDVIDAETSAILVGRALVSSDGSFDGTLDDGETVTVDYEAEVSEPPAGCEALCGRGVRLRLLYGIDRGLAPQPVADTEVQSSLFELDC